MEGDSAGRGSANLQQTDGRAGGAARPDSLASIHYVSGAMGRPLGVEITHANLMHLIRWHRRAFRITAADIASQLTLPGHEAAIWEIWPYLAAGASLHFADAYAGGSARLLREWLPTNSLRCPSRLPGWPSD
jgi:non-ribosomal peptide synthetase component F